MLDRPASMEGIAAARNPGVPPARAVGARPVSSAPAVRGVAVSAPAVRGAAVSAPAAGGAAVSASAARGAAISAPVGRVPSSAAVLPDAGALVGGALDAPQAAVLASAFKALGDPVRLRLLSMIASAAAGEICVCDLSAAFPLTGPTISHHLRILREAGLVDSARRGTWVYYRPVPATLSRLAELLDARLLLERVVAPVHQ